MFGLGTLINAAAIISAGAAGIILGKYFTKKIQDSLTMGCGVSVLFIGIVGAIEEMLVFTEEGITSQGSMMVIISIALGAIIGEILDIEGKLESLGEWLKKKTGHASDNAFLDAFITASLTVCIGAMAIVGAIEDALLADISVLLAKSVLDFIIIAVMTSSMGIGSMFSFVPVLLLQGSVTLLASFIEPIMIPAALSNLSLVGSILIFCVGVNLVWGKKIRVASLLPALLFAVGWAFI